MIKTRVVLCPLALAGLMLAAASHAETRAESSTHGTASSGSTSTEARAIAGAHASATVDRRRRERLDAIRQKGAGVAEKDRTRAQSRMEATAWQVDESAAQNGDLKIAQRLSAEFGMSAEALLDEKNDLGVSWGRLMIAHTLAANSRSGVTASDLVTLERQGTGWGQIAAGLGLDLGGAVSGIKAEGQVASGAAHGDGKVAVIRGERAGLNGQAALNAGMRTDHAQAGAGLGAGIRLGH